jgi:formate/nitrite transporter
MSDLFGFDAFSPKEIARKVEDIGVAKARLPLRTMLMLGILAGAFIGLGALYYVIIRSDASLGIALRQLLGGMAFALGLILVTVAGAELFTGNNLLVMAWADRKISTVELLRSWFVVCIGNFIGAVGLAGLVYLSRHAEINDGLIGQTYLQIAAQKISMPFWTAFFRGVLCNALVCLAVWMALAGRSVVDKVVAVVVPVSAFVAAGFEHSVANMYLIPMAIFLQEAGSAGSQGVITWQGFLSSLVPVLLGNLVGGSLLVGLVYYLIYGSAPDRDGLTTPDPSADVKSHGAD